MAWRCERFTSDAQFEWSCSKFPCFGVWDLGFGFWGLGFEFYRATSLIRNLYRGTSLIRNRTPLGPYSRTMPRLPWRS